MNDALLIGNFQPDYCLEFEGTCPYLGAFVILPGYIGVTDAVCMKCVMSMSCMRIHEHMKINKWWDETQEPRKDDKRTDEST